MSRRALFLAIVAAWEVLIGTSYVAGPVTQSRANGFAWLPWWADANELGWAWVAAGAAGVWVAARRSRGRAEQAAFAALAAPPTLWVIVFAAAWATGAHPFGWVSALSYAGWVAVILLGSSWPDPAEGGPHGGA